MTCRVCDCVPCTCPRFPESDGDRLAIDPDLYKASSSVALEFNCTCDSEQGNCTCEDEA